MNDVAAAVLLGFFVTWLVLFLLAFATARYNDKLDAARKDCTNDKG